MKKFIDTVSTTIKAFKLLSNPLMIEKLHRELAVDIVKTKTRSTRLGTKDAYFHKHFIVQVVS